MTEIIKLNREERQKEFREAKILRDIQRALKENGIDISFEIVKTTVAEYERLRSEPTPGSAPREIVVDGDMVRSHLSGDSE